MERFGRYSQFIYGAPEIDIFNNIINLLKTKLESLGKLENESQKLAIAQLQKLVESTMSQSNFADNFKLPKVKIPENTPVESAEEVKELFELALDDAGLSKKWQVEVRKEGNNNPTMLTSSKNKKIIIPNNEGMKRRSENRKLTLEMVIGLIMHEINTHALRNYN